MEGDIRKMNERLLRRIASNLTFIKLKANIPENNGE